MNLSTSFAVVAVLLVCIFNSISAFTSSNSQQLASQARTIDTTGASSRISPSKNPLKMGGADDLYLETNAKKAGVTVLSSGLQYRVLREGPENGPSPGPTTKCTCHYEGTTVGGKVFDSSYQRGQPIDFAPNQVIKGWTEAMQLMKEGDKWELVIPSDLAYGNRQMGPDIYPGATLIFKMEIIKVHE
mmetsp:Transcript_14696/g.19255  ORF Transcript_14696/g.19255 Transcript_14696/m.19255 type:complete len:187 (+) Transcript_14696:93-653(+)